MVAECGALVLGAVDASGLQLGDQFVDDVLDRAREQLGEDVEAVDRAVLDVTLPLVGDPGRRADERAVLRRDLDDQVADGQVALGGESAPAGDPGRLAGAVRCSIEIVPRDGSSSPSAGSMSGRGPSGSYPERSLPQYCSRKARARGPVTCSRWM